MIKSARRFARVLRNALDLCDYEMSVELDRMEGLKPQTRLGYLYTSLIFCAPCFLGYHDHEFCKGGEDGPRGDFCLRCGLYGAFTKPKAKPMTKLSLWPARAPKPRLSIFDKLGLSFPLLNVGGQIGTPARTIVFHMDAAPSDDCIVGATVLDEFGMRVDGMSWMSPRMGLQYLTEHPHSAIRICADGQDDYEPA